MALDLLDLYYLMNSDGDLWRKVEAAAFKAATAIKYEDPLTANHAARLAWATAVNDDLKAWTVANRTKVLENATVSAAGHAATDNDVQFVVNSLAPVAA